MYRQRIGNRRHAARIEKHDGTQESDHGHPSYTTPGDWDTVVESWPCEVLTTSGGELIRGRQVQAETTHVLFGEYFGADNVTAEMRAVVGGITYSIVAAYDPDGDSREMRIEARREVS